MSPLANEILIDLQTVPEFEAGVTLTGLKDWLGEDFPALKGALAELQVRKLVHHVGSRFYAGARARPRWHISPEQQESVRRLLADGKRQYEVAEALGVSTQTVGRIARRAA